MLLFFKYSSDQYAGQPNAPLAIPEGSGFADRITLKGKAEIGGRINKQIIAPLLAASQQLGQGDCPDFNDQAKLDSGKELVERRTDLIVIVETPALNFARDRADDGDILGDAYEYLIRHFAVESGKSKGQFLTSAELGRPVTLYGQGKDAATSRLAGMILILPSNTTAIIWQDNTLADPQLKGGEQFKQFDFLVGGHPPFSTSAGAKGCMPPRIPTAASQASASHRPSRASS